MSVFHRAPELVRYVLGVQSCTSWCVTFDDESAVGQAAAGCYRLQMENRSGWAKVRADGRGRSLRAFLWRPGTTALTVASPPLAGILLARTSHSEQQERPNGNDSNKRRTDDADAAALHQGAIGSFSGIYRAGNSNTCIR